MAGAPLARDTDVWRPAAPRVTRLLAVGLGIAALAIGLIIASPLSGRASMLLDTIAWTLMGAAMVAANLDRQRRTLASRRTGHRLLLVAIAVVYGANAIGHLALVLGDSPHAPWVYDLALVAGIVPLVVGLGYLCWPPGTTAREAWLIIGDAVMTSCAMAVIWILVTVPANEATQTQGSGSLFLATPWAQFAAMVAIVTMAAASRRPGALSIQQVILLQVSVIAFVNGDILKDLAADWSPQLGSWPLLVGAWVSALLYVLFARRPELEDEGPRQFMARAVWSALLPMLIVVIMALTVVGYRLWVGPLPTFAVVITLLALVLGSVLIVMQRVLLARDEQDAKMARIRSSLQESAKAQWFGALLGQSHDLVTVVDHDGLVVFQTPAITTRFGFSQDSWAGSHISGIFEDCTREQLNRLLLMSQHQSEHVPVELVLVDAASDRHETETVIIPLRTDGADGYVLTTRDVTDRRRLRAALVESGQRDPLTGLNNRDGFLSRLQLVMPTEAYRLAVVLLDIVNFRDLNDSRGHDVGDALLRSVASAMDRLPPSVVAAARIGADEFAMVIVADSIEREVGHIDHTLRETLRRVVIDDGPAIDAAFHLGYVTAHPGNDSAAGLMERADLALAAARTTGGRTAVRYEQGMRAALVNRLQQEADLRQALDSDRLLVFYQPIVDLSSGRLASVEALVRMRDPDGGLIPPDQFIPQAEELGLIGRLGLKVLDVALTDITDINAALGREVTVSVNVSAAQIEPELPQIVMDRLRARGVSASTLVLEVTESSLVRHAQSSDILAALRTMGCEIALDDFGTGYSSMSYLVGMPVDELKIDRSFIARLADSQRSLSLVRVLLQMAATLGLDVIAEGVETVEQADLLRGMGCPRAQGYLYAAPMPLAELLPILTGPTGDFQHYR